MPKKALKTAHVKRLQKKSFFFFAQVQKISNLLPAHGGHNSIAGAGLYHSAEEEKEADKELVSEYNKMKIIDNACGLQPIHPLKGYAVSWDFRLIRELTKFENFFKNLFGIIFVYRELLRLLFFVLKSLSFFFLVVCVGSIFFCKIMVYTHNINFTFLVSVFNQIPDISCCKMLAFSIAQRLLCSNSNNMHFVRCHKVSHIPS